MYIIKAIMPTFLAGDVAREKSASCRLSRVGPSVSWPLRDEAAPTSPWDKKKHG